MGVFGADFRKFENFSLANFTIFRISVHMYFKMNIFKKDEIVYFTETILKVSLRICV